MNLLSEHNRILRVGEGGSQEYFAGPNINITDHVISGKYWDNEINSAISSTSGDIVNEAFNQSTAWTEEQGYLTAHQDVDNLPYVQNSALGYNGNLISSISGDGFFAESANNSYHADDADHATYADSATHADSADFVATANFANSASSALNAEVANVAYTALTAQFLDGGWEHDEDGFITAYNNSAFAGAGGGRYEGIEPIVVNNEEMRISAKSAVLGVQEPLYFVEDSETATIIGIHDSAFPTFEGTEDGKISAINGSALNADPVVDYSAGNNIDITDHIISVTGSVPSADRAAYAVSATSSHYSHSAIEAGSANYATESNHTHSADSATYDSLGRKIVDTYLTAHQELPDWTPTIQNASGNAYNSAVNWVVDQHYLTAVTGDNTPYSAGANIDITDHVVSGKDWTSEIQEASANAVAQIPDVTNLPYVQNTALNIANGAITSISSYSVGHSQVPVSGESGIYLTKKNGTVYIGYSGEGGGGGAEYEGVAPIVVNNVEHKISAQSAVLGVQEPLYFVEDSETATVIGISGLPEVEGLMYESALGKSNNTITSYNGTAFAGGSTGKYIPYTNISTGDSGTQAYNVDKGIRVTSTSGWVEMYNQNKENENEAHLQVGQNYADGHSFWAELDGAGGGFLQMNWNSGTIGPNAHSSYSDGTCSSIGLFNGALVYRSANSALTSFEDDEASKVWQLGSERLRFWNQWGYASFGPRGMEVFDTAGNSWFTSAGGGRTYFIVSGSAGNGARGAAELAPQYINFYNDDWSLNQTWNTDNIADTKALYNHVQSASAEWGKTYSGISPIIVDNTARTIDISGYGLSGINVNIWKDDVHHVIVISAATGGSIDYTTGSI